MLYWCDVFFSFVLKAFAWPRCLCSLFYDQSFDWLLSSAVLELLGILSNVKTSQDKTRQCWACSRAYSRTPKLTLRRDDIFSIAAAFFCSVTMVLSFPICCTFPNFCCFLLIVATHLLPYLTDHIQTRYRPWELIEELLTSSRIWQSSDQKGYVAFAGNFCWSA